MPSASPVAKVLSLLGAFVATSVVLGLLGAGLVLPAVGASGQATKESVSLFKGLPGDLEVNPLNQQSRILAADGSVIATPYDENRIVVPLDKIAPVMRQAQVAIEDHRFYEHGGVDPEGIMRAFASNAVSGSTQGASTLTQQYVKVVLQDQALKRGDKEAAAKAVSQSGTEGYLRKLQQIKFSVSLESKMSKNQILGGYLNTVYMGDQTYGVEAAARNYFNVTAAELDLPQAAMLAGLVQRPGATDPIRNPKAAKARRNVVIQRMATLKMITPEEASKAKASPLGLKEGGRTDQSCASSKYAYYCYYVQSWLMQQPSLGKTPKQRLQKLRSGGLIIKTALDPKKMRTIERDLRKRVPVGNDQDVQASAIMVEPGTGLVQAMGQNTEYSNSGGEGKTSVNYAAPSGSASAGFPVGSAIKIFAIVEAFKQGRPIDSTIDVPRMTAKSDEGSPRAQFTRELFNDDCGLGREVWKVGNSHQVASGPMSLTQATGESVNTAFAQLVGELGACKVHKTMTDMGLTRPTGTAIKATPSNIVLGSDSSTPLSLANSYATIAAEGKECTPRPVRSISTATGKPLKLSGAGCKQVMSKDVARATAKIFHAPFTERLGTAKKVKLANGRDAFGKTGTTQNAIASWFVGSTPSLTTAVMVGRANSQKPMKGITLAGRHYSDFIFGDTIAAPVWKDIMDDSLKGTKKEKFKDPSEKLTGGKKTTVPRVSGMTAEQARAVLKANGLDANGPTGSERVTSTEPSAGSSIAENSSVELRTDDDDD